MQLQLLLALAFMTTLISGCASRPSHSEVSPPAASDEQATALAGPKVTSGSESDLVPVVNAWCPIVSENPVSSTKATSRALTRNWRGQRVGFCCEGCPATWDGLSDEQRSAALSRAIRRENNVGLPSAAANEP